MILSYFNSCSGSHYQEGRIQFDLDVWALTHQNYRTVNFTSDKRKINKAHTHTKDPMMYKKCIHTMWFGRKKLFKIKNKEQGTWTHSMRSTCVCIEYTLCGLLRSACEWCIESSVEWRKNMHKTCAQSALVDINLNSLALRVQCGRTYSVWYFDGEFMILLLWLNPFRNENQLGCAKQTRET